MTKLKIWCLFSIENLHDQPDHNLVRFWEEKPSIEELSRFLGFPLDTAADSDIVRTVAIWTGHRIQRTPGATTYFLEQVTEGEAP